MKLSIAIIAKNEEADIEKCLESIKGADEIIVVDTGSIDKTKEIAQKYTDKVYDFKWIDDFSAARNFALAKCTGDWVLSIDCDEILQEGGIDAIRKLMDIPEDALGVKMISGNHVYRVPRCFKNKPETVWIGAIHEMVNTGTALPTDIEITFGTSEAHKFDPDRNIRILEKSHKQFPMDSRYMYYLGREYGYRAEYEKAINTLGIYTEIATWLPEKADAYFIMALCFWYTNRGEAARQNCLCALNINANFKAAVQLMGIMSFENNKKQWDKMAETATNENTLFARSNPLTI